MGLPHDDRLRLQKKFCCSQKKLAKKKVLKILMNVHFYFIANNVLGDLLFMFICFVSGYHTKIGCLFTPHKTRNIICLAIFSLTGTPQWVDTWPHYGNISVGYIFQEHIAPISGTKLKVINFAVANLCSYSLSCTVLVQIRMLSVFPKSPTAGYVQCGDCTGQCFVFLGKTLWANITFRELNLYSSCWYLGKGAVLCFETI